MIPASVKVAEFVATTASMNTSQAKLLVVDNQVLVTVTILPTTTAAAVSSPPTFEWRYAPLLTFYLAGAVYQRQAPQ